MAAAVAADAAYQSHLINNTAADFTNGDGFTQTSAAPAVNGTLTSNAATLESNVNNATITDPSGSPAASAISSTEPGSAAVSTVITQSNSQDVTYDAIEGGANSYGLVINNATNSTFNASTYGVSTIIDLSGGNTLDTGANNNYDFSGVGDIVNNFNTATADISIVNGSGDTINISGSSSTYIDGPDTVNINPANADNLDLFSGPITFNTGTGTPYSPSQVAALNGLNGGLSTATMNSNTDATYSGSGQNVDIAGTNINATGISGGNVQENGNGQSVINASNSNFTIGGGATITVNGTNDHDTVSGSVATLYQNGGSITLGFYISGVAIHGNNLTIVEDYLSDSTVYGTGDVIHTRSQPNYAVDAAATAGDPNSVTGFAPGGTDDSVVTDGSGYGAYGGYGFSEAPPTTGTNIGIIASFDAQLGDQSEAISASSAALQAQSNLASATGAKTDTPEFEGAKWASKTITWSLATTYDPIGAQLSGLISTQYVPLIQQAFHDWSVLSGLKFEQVAATASPDIELGWSTFNPAVTGVLGYTGFSYMNGALQSGALISLENPADDPLAKDSSGQLAYTGTQTELEQLLIHQIGQALGLADDSDPKSIMYAVLSSKNRFFDATDLAGIQDLYDSSSVSGPASSTVASDATTLSSNSPITVASSLVSSLTPNALTPFASEADQLINAMAVFNPSASPSTYTPLTLASVSSSMTLAASGH